MEDKDTNRVNMIYATTNYCDTNSAVTAGIVAFVSLLAAVKAKMILINGFNQIGGGTTTGVTTDTKVLRKTMQDIALKCANATLGFANSINNNTLAAEVNFTESKLKDEKMEDVDDVCQGIHDATNANIAGASNFGIGATDVTDLQASIDLYRAATSNTRGKRISISEAKKQASRMIREVIDDLLVKQMDKIVNTLKVANFAYWEGYRQAREIINLGSTSAKVRGTVLDENDVPLIGVTFSIYETGTQSIVKQVLSVAKGLFNASQLPTGDFDFKWEKAGYITKTETNVHIGPGKELKRKVVLVLGSNSVIREGDVAPSGIANVPVFDIEPTPLTTVTIELSHLLRIFGSNSPGSAPGPGNPFWDVPAGSVTKSLVEFGTLTGINDMNQFLNVQNLGMVTAHFKITFSNVNP